MTVGQAIEELESLTHQLRVYRDASAILDYDDAICERLRQIVAEIGAWWIGE